MTHNSLFDLVRFTFSTDLFRSDTQDESLYENWPTYSSGFALFLSTLEIQYAKSSIFLGSLVSGLRFDGSYYIFIVEYMLACITSLKDGN